MKFTQYILFFLFLFIGFQSTFSQERQIEYESERFERDEERYPGAIILRKVTKQVYFVHEGIQIWCDQAIHYRDENFFRAYGNVRMRQGDTINMNSEYAEYNGTTQFAFASGNVVLREPQSSLSTDSLFFNRITQEAYYNSGGIIRDTASVLTSRIGRYFLETKKYSFISDVKLVNPKYTINSTQLDFYSGSGHAYLYGPSTIESETSTIYCERGFYDTRSDFGYFVRNSQVNYENRELRGDSIYFNRNTNFASATNNIVVTDTANNSIIKGHYAEVYRDKDSVFITKRAVAINIQEKDSIYIHGDTLMITGKPENRVLRGFRDVRIYKSDMSGKSDSIHVDQQKGLTKMIGRPILWSENGQMTGDTIHLLNNMETEQLDTLKVFNNAFMIQKDSLGAFNQVKGKELLGLFEENQLHQVDIIKNTETIFYSRAENGELIGINKTLSSSIRLLINDNEIEDIYYYKQIDGNLMPEEDFPENARRLRGFNWRGDERLLSKEDLFAGKPEPDLPEIQGMETPLEEADFFEKEGEQPLLNKNSRLKKSDLREAKKNSENLQPKEGTKKLVPVRALKKENR